MHAVGVVSAEFPVDNQVGVDIALIREELAQLSDALGQIGRRIEGMDRQRRADAQAILVELRHISDQTNRLERHVNHLEEHFRVLNWIRQIQGIVEQLFANLQPVRIVAIFYETHEIRLSDGSQWKVDNLIDQGRIQHWAETDPIQVLVNGKLSNGRDSYLTAWLGKSLYHFLLGAYPFRLRNDKVNPGTSIVAKRIN